MVEALYDKELRRSTFSKLGFEVNESVDEGDDSPWIAIDLGTTHSCVGLWINGRVEMMQNDSDGKTITPSVVAYRAGHTTIVG